MYRDVLFIEYTYIPEGRKEVMKLTKPGKSWYVVSETSTLGWLMGNKLPRITNDIFDVSTDSKTQKIFSNKKLFLIFEKAIIEKRIYL